MKAAEALGSIVPDSNGDGVVDAEEIKNSFRVWLFRAIIALIVSTIPPATSFTYGWGTKTAELRAASRKRQQEVDLRKRQLQKEVLLQVVDVAKKAEFGDTKSVYRLGIIAHMVNENSAVFGLRLTEAETTMQRMMDRLSPISGLRDRIKETDILLASLSAQITEAQDSENQIWEELRVIRRRLEDKKLSKRARFLLALQERNKDRDLVREQVVRSFYTERLQRNRKLRAYFDEQLKQQVKVLRDALKDAERTRQRIRVSDRDVKDFIDRIQSRDKKVARKAADELQRMAAAVVRRSLKSQQEAERLEKDLRSEQEELRVTKGALATCIKSKPQTSCPACPECLDCDMPAAASGGSSAPGPMRAPRRLPMTVRRLRRVTRPHSRRASMQKPAPRPRKMHQLEGLF